MSRLERCQSTEAQEGIRQVLLRGLQVSDLQASELKQAVLLRGLLSRQPVQKSPARSRTRPPQSMARNQPAVPARDKAGVRAWNEPAPLASRIAAPPFRFPGLPALEKASQKLARQSDQFPPSRLLLPRLLLLPALQGRKSPVLRRRPSVLARFPQLGRPVQRSQVLAPAPVLAPGLARVLVRQISVPVAALWPGRRLAEAARSAAQAMALARIRKPVARPARLSQSSRRFHSPGRRKLRAARRAGLIGRLVRCLLQELVLPVSCQEAS